MSMLTAHRAIWWQNGAAEASQARRRNLPTWLDGQTIAIIGTMLTVGVGIGAMVLASTSAMRAEMDGLHARIDDVRRS